MGVAPSNALGSGRAESRAEHGQRSNCRPSPCIFTGRCISGVLAFWSKDASPKQEDTLALLDQSLAMFVGWLTSPRLGPQRFTSSPRENHMATIAELMDALPESAGEVTSPPRGIASEHLEDWALRPVPVGAFRRLRVLGTLQAEVAAAYLFSGPPRLFQSATEKERLLAETQWSTALRVLDSMSYLRGATIKIGQMMANFPDIMPGPFVETFERLHFDAPPMHWSLLKEMVHNELGDDPEDRFAAFDKRAFAAASMGQVHRARLQSGRRCRRQDSVSRHRPHHPRRLPQPVLLPAPAAIQPRLGEHPAAVRGPAPPRRARDRLRTGGRHAGARPQRCFARKMASSCRACYREHSTSRVLTMDYLAGETI